MKASRMFALATMLVAGLALSACAVAQQVAGGVIDVATSLSSSTPSQVTTFKDATLVADGITNGIGWAADNAETFHLSLATLHQLDAINDSIHAAWSVLNTANGLHQSLNFAAFNAALTAYATYKAEAAIPNAPTTVVNPTTAMIVDPSALYALNFIATKGNLHRRLTIALR